MKKQLLAALLCVAIALSLLPMSALAAESKTTPAWAQAYRDYIQEDVQKFRADVNSSYFGYSLVNIDEDAIPELYINYGGVYIQDGDVYIQGGGPAEFGQQLCTFTNGKVYGKKFSGYSELSYLPGKNCILESGVRMGTYWDDVYSLSSGELIQIASGNHYFVNFTEPQYSWNNREVDEATYDKNLNDIFPTSQAEHHYDWKSYQEMLDFLDQQEEVQSAELKQQYIKEHMEYASSDAFKKEIVPGYGPLLRSILDDVNDNKAVSSYKFLSDVSDMVSLKFKNLDTTEEYELLLAQILFDTESKNAVAKSYEEYLAEEISTLGDLLIDGKTFADSISSATREKIRSVLASISATDPGSQEFNQKCGRLFDILDGYDDVDLASRFLEKVKGAGGDFLAGFAIDEAKQVCDTMSEYFMYLAAGEAYAKTSDAFGTIILEMRRSLPVSSKNNTLFNPVSKPTIQEKPLLRALGLDKYTGPALTSSDPHAPIQLAEIARALEKFYTNITDYKNEGAEAIAENALEGFIDGSAEALLDNSIQAAISVFSGLPIVREYEVIKTALSTGKFAVDVLTNVDDQAYLGSTLLRLCALSYILHPTIEKIAGTPADWNTQQVLSPLQKSVSLEDYQFNRAVDFDESINIYKSILSVASDYGESYARACLTAANKSILNLNKSETVSWYSTAISAAIAQKAACKEIHCHTPGLEYDPNTNRVTYKSANLKVYTVACPVDVTVKTDTGKQIAFLSNRGSTIAEGYEQYFYTVESKETAGDYIKVAVVPASYKVTLQGSGSGTMNAYVAEVNDGTLQRSGGFYDIPVTRNTEGQFVSGKTVSEDDLILNGKTVDIVPDMPFKDVKSSDWFYNDVKYVYEKGMMAGTAADVFAPNATTTRAMIVTILYRLEGSPAVTGTSAFVDVPAGQWYTDAVNWAAANQIVKGTSATTFAPNDSITREQMAAILYRYAQYKGYDVTKQADLSGYSDNGQVSAYAKDALAWANAAKLINGVTNTTLAPQGNATRAQVSAILHRFCDGVVK